jgi:hypothetical protein
MVAPGPARELLQHTAAGVELHPFNVYWIWVFSTEKRWWQEARRRFFFNAGGEAMEELQR